LNEAGKWLKINGEGIYATRPREGELWKEGDNLRFTRSKDNKTVYAFAYEWPGESMVLKSVKAAKGSKLFMLGIEKPLNWKSTESGLVIDLPAALKGMIKNNQAYGFKITVS
jgi:alpha-L-fucosidase